jgi:hypothetical protein
MSETYRVQQGDHIHSIAATFGFQDYRIIWDDPKNAALRQKRLNPSVLLPGDAVYIPDKKLKTEPAATSKVHRFVLKGEPLKLRITLRDFDNEPIPNMDCELEVEGVVSTLKTNSKGLIEKAIPTTAETGVLRVPELGLELPVKIGYLDPHDEESGWKARLINLGYYPRGLDDQDTEQLAHSIEEFQCDHGLPVTGKPDQTTKEKLEAVHGS